MNDIEESIKKLKDLVELRKQKTKNKIEFDTCIVGTKDIENIIKENKELKVKNKELTDKCIELATTINTLKTDYKEQLKDNFENRDRWE